ncbi:MAG: CoA pyrophosphatase [Bacteroidota bacterium]
MAILYSDELVTRVRNRLRQPLPGWSAQSLMATETHRQARLKVPSLAQRAGVLLLLYPDKQQQLCFPLIQRPTYNGAHSGQIAFPGGKIEPDDQNIEDTALRETQEEIGVGVTPSQILGRLSDLYIPVSQIVVTPVVAFVKEKPVYTPDSYEVAGTLDVSASDFLDQVNQSIKKIKVRNMTLEVPAYLIQGHIIWGATAMMLAEFFSVLEEVK